MASIYKSMTLSSSVKSPGIEHGLPKNKQRVLVLSSRGVTSRHRHLLNDLYTLMPHSRKDAKLDTKTKLYQLNELADLYNCNNVLFFEARKAKDLYAWMSKAPNGPTVKMHVQNLHTMEELHFIGNCLRGSRPVLSFDAAFNSQSHLRIIKELLTHTFGVPKGSRKTKPFVDHVMAFTVADGKIWIRCYQIEETERSRSASNAEGNKHRKSSDNLHADLSMDCSLVEIGPRFVLTPIIIQEGSFGGPILYENREFVSPNQVRSNLRSAKAGRHHLRVAKAQARDFKKNELSLRSSHGRKTELNPLDDKTLFS